jgi:hypothetical protein
MALTLDRPGTVGGANYDLLYLSAAALTFSAR